MSGDPQSPVGAFAAGLVATGLERAMARMLRIMESRADAPVFERDVPDPK